MSATRPDMDPVIHVGARAFARARAVARAHASALACELERALALEHAPHGPGSVGRQRRDFARQRAEAVVVLERARARLARLERRLDGLGLRAVVEEHHVGTWERAMESRPVSTRVRSRGADQEHRLGSHR